MLAVHGRPFDSPEHFFEFKWDGIRAEAMVEGGGLRLMSRSGRDVTAWYPALAALAALPEGLALDGEVVAFRDGKPDFELVLDRGRGDAAAPVRFVAFDILYRGFAPVLGQPFSERRQILEEVTGAVDCPPLLLSEGVVGGGRALYERASEQGLEGVVAKRLASPYAPGRRNGSWIKIKRRRRVQAVVIGFIEKGDDDFQSLLVAGTAGAGGASGGPLRYLGRVGGGFTEAMRARLNRLLRERPRKAPLVACPERARWVEPGLYCTVSFTELTQAGILRAPVFEGLIEG